MKRVNKTKLKSSPHQHHGYAKVLSIYGAFLLLIFLLFIHTFKPLDNIFWRILDISCVLLSGGGIVLIALEAHWLLDRDLYSRRADVANLALEHARNLARFLEDYTKEDISNPDGIAHIFQSRLRRARNRERPKIHKWCKDLTEALGKQGDKLPGLSLTDALSNPMPTTPDLRQAVEDLVSATQRYINSHQSLIELSNRKKIYERIITYAPFLVLAGVVLQIAILFSKPLAE